VPAGRFVVFLQNHDQVGNRGSHARLSTRSQPQVVNGQIDLQACSGALIN
jgi:1,4-alpha-glucan branching enzyme